MKKLLVVILVLAALAVCGAGRLRLHQLGAGQRPTFQEVFNLPPGRVLRQMDLGWHTLAASLLFLRANVYYGHHILSDEELPWLDSFTDALLELDPDFRAAYLWAALVSKFRRRLSSSVPQGAIERSNEILERGRKRFPDDYRFPFRLAFNYYYDLGRLDEALPYFEQASRLEGAPSWLSEKLSDLYNKKGQRDMAVRILKHLIATTDDPALSQGLRDRLLGYLELEESQALVEERQAVLHAWQKDFPYIGFDLYLAIRP